MRSSRYQNEALWAVALQFPLAIILSPFLAGTYGLVATGSYVVGALVCVLPNFYLYRRVFAHQGARAAKKIFKSLYWGEMVKILFTAAGFGLAAMTDWVLPIWLFVGYIMAQLCFVITPVVLGIVKFKNNQKMSTQ
ncbi:MAG: ATP synthase subunit I [Candidatus Berkiella sp.]